MACIVPRPSRAVLAVLLSVFVQTAVAADPESAAPAPVVFVKAGHLFDATSDDLRDNVVLVIQGERFTRIGPAAQVAIPAGAEVIDLSHAWVLPGLIDCHTHLSFRSDQYDPINQVKLTPFDFGFYAVVNADRTLLAGFTSV